MSGDKKSSAIFLELRCTNFNRFDKLGVKMRQRMVEEIENVVIPEFSNSSSDIFYLPIGGIADNPKVGIEDGHLSLTGEDMKEIFDPLINQIIELVQEQIDIVCERPIRLLVCAPLRS